jgi:hypothetical protein
MLLSSSTLVLIHVTTILGADEYFYKRQQRRQPHDDMIDTDNDTDLSRSTDSSMHSNEERMGGQHEFDDMIKRYEEKQQSK